VPIWFEFVRRKESSKRNDLEIYTRGQRVRWSVNIRLEMIHGIGCVGHRICILVILLVTVIWNH
jgi:hypothetical protein